MQAWQGTRKPTYSYGGALPLACERLGESENGWVASVARQDQESGVTCLRVTV